MIIARTPNIMCAFAPMITAIYAIQNEKNSKTAFSLKAIVKESNILPDKIWRLQLLDYIKFFHIFPQLSWALYRDLLGLNIALTRFRFLRHHLSTKFKKACGKIWRKSRHDIAAKIKPKNSPRGSIWKQNANCCTEAKNIDKNAWPLKAPEQQIRPIRDPGCYHTQSLRAASQFKARQLR